MLFEKRVKLRLTDFDYKLPKTRIAQEPWPRREYSKLMVLHRETETIEHKRFHNIVDYLKKNDLVIVNETKVFPARLFAVKDRTDAKVEVFLLRELANDLWEVLVKPARKVRIEYDTKDFYEIIDRIGHAPLPPYISRPDTPKDKERYQTVFASNRGAVAAPTAGLHFTDDLLKKLKAKGVRVAPIVLHIGLGTFRPVQVEDLTRHQMDSEYFEVPPETAIAINETRERGKRIFAVGTSSVRALETVVVSGFQVTPKRGWTDKFIYPPCDFKMTDAIITNFHQPKSTLLMLLCAFTEREFIFKAYREALKKNYRFLSYGDAMLIL